ncbi:MULTISPECIES: type IV toxin-antitoxin system AbiEi family antitoxin [unclassified Nocardioides]|uniref:type IV toxin-antitoxin system AbiEi family antitoxin n=1 Tax=unclassified Nocardioides TaxID=2615069 RepID=UPI0006F34F3D|nr:MULTISPECIES: DUF559 domain-containing protein [unclassified Nocardioides]KQY64318.1 hypothetical protein ASD30_05085 [Nocardioides sp. Root140]KRF16334.1 hypothetical protein ASH02_07110 [Nocardioides sp. Soil796]
MAELGVSEFTLRRWLRSGVVRRPLTGVYCSASVEDTLELRASCAALVLPEDAVVCDRSAAWLWGVDVHEPDERFAVPDLEVAVKPGHTPPRRKAVRGVERELAEEEVIQVHGVKVTTPVRTALDVACLRGRWRALATLDAFMREHELTHEEFGTAVVRLSGRRGVTQARELYPLASPLSESQGESWVRGAIHDSGLLMPEPQVEIREDGVVMARIDLAYRRLRIAVEYDGEEFHAEEQAEHDEARRDWLRERGWYVIVVRKHQLAGRAREQWLDELGAIIAARSAPQKRKYARSRVPWVPAQ